MSGNGHSYMNTMKPILNLQRDVDPFTLAYIECALWTECNPDNEDLADKSWTDLADETLQRMVADCAKFQAENQSRLADYPSKNAGHDFWLTRNGHGAGFWENDFGSEEDCESLTKDCKRFGEFSLYLGDDGKIYGQ